MDKAETWRLQVPGMSCGHCVKAVTDALRALDPQAKVEVELAAKRVSVQTVSPRAAVVAALDAAGYAAA